MIIEKWLKRLAAALLITGAFIACSCTPEEQPKDDDDPIVDPTDPDEPEKPAFREEADDKAKDPVRTYDYSKLKEMKHPRVLMTEEDFKDLKTKVTSGRFENKTLYKMHKLTIDLADEYLASTEKIEYKLDGKRLLAQSQNALKRLFALSYAYKLTGKASYLNKATEDLKTICSFSDWHTSHYLDTGEMALGAAIAYDWLYYDLSYADRVRARRAMSTFALATSTSNGFHTNYGNWNQVCNAGVMAAAIAVYEKDKANAVNVIEKGLQTNALAMASIYSPDGNYTEGYDYWGYGTGFQVVIMRLLEAAFGNCNGLDEIAGFNQTAGYMLFMAGPVGKDFPYADGGVGSERPKLAMWYFAAKQNDPSLLLNEMRLYNAGKYPSATEARLIPLIPCVIKDVNLDNFSSAVPSEDIWTGRGVTPIAIVHTGWKFDATDHYLGIKGGKAAAGHGHMDAGSFVYDALGKRWSNDYTRPSYGGIETATSQAGGNFWNSGQTSLRWDICKMNNLFHSTVSFFCSDKSIKKTYISDMNVAGTATLEESYNTTSTKGAKFNLTAAYSDQIASFYRTVTLENETDLRIVDEITAKSSMAAPLQWRMMTPATGTVEDGGITLNQGGVKMYLKSSSSDNTVSETFTVWGKGRPSDWTSRSWDGTLDLTPVGFSATIPAGKTVTFTTILSPNK